MRDQVLAVVVQVVTELNDELQYDFLEQPKEGTPLFGGADGIDSLSLVNLVVALESEVADQLGHDVALADEKAMSQANSPYRSVGALTDFIVARMAETTV